MTTSSTRSPNAREHAGLAPRLANPGAGSCVLPRRSCARFFLLLACCLLASPTWAANVRLYFRSNTNETVLLTNAVISTPISGNLLANGIPVAQGIPSRLRFQPDGLCTNFYAAGFYSLTNALLGSSGIVIRIDDDGPQLYDITNVIWSGYNKFVAIVGSNLPPTYNSVTNALGFLPVTQTQLNNTNTSIRTAVIATNTALISQLNSASNILQLQIGNATNSGITASTATNIALGAALNATNKLDPDLRSLVTATTNGLSTRVINATNKLDTDLRSLVTATTNGLNTRLFDTNTALRTLIADSTNKLDTDLRSLITVTTNGLGTRIINATNKLDTDLRSLVTATTNGLNTRLLDTNTTLRAFSTNAAAYQSLLATNKLDTDVRTLVTATTNGLNTRLLNTNTALLVRITEVTNNPVLSAFLTSDLITLPGKIQSGSGNIEIAAESDTDFVILSGQLSANLVSSTNLPYSGLSAAARTSVTNSSLTASVNATNKLDTDLRTLVTATTNGLNTRLLDTNTALRALIVAGAGSATNAIPLSNGSGTNTTLVFQTANWGTNQTLAANQFYSAVSFGTSNTVGGPSPGGFNLLLGGINSVIGGFPQFSTIINSSGASVESGATSGTIISSDASIIQGGGRSIVLGGYSNIVQSSSSYSAAVNGFGNYILGNYNTVASGLSNSVWGNLNWSGGERGIINNHSGVFLWAGAGPGAFTSTASGQFLVRATNGLAINTNNPNGSALRVVGNATADSLSIGSITNLILFATTNNLAVTNAGSAAANGTYKFAGGAYFTNTFNSAVVTNNGSTWQITSNATVLYSSSTLENPAWTIQSGVSPAAKSYYGSFQNLAGQVWLGTISSTNLDYRLAHPSYPTNYVPADFVPTAGLIKLVGSNNALFAVSTTATNLISAP